MQSKIKVFLFIDSFMVGGMHKQMLYLFKNIDKNKFCPVLCVLSDHGGLKIDYFETGCKIYNLKWKFTGDLMPIFRLVKVLKAEKPDIVMITEAVNFIYYRISKLFFIKKIIHIGSFRALTFWKGHLNLIYKFLDILICKWFYNFCDNIVVNSMAMKTHYQKILKCDNDKNLTLIYNASDFKFDLKANDNNLKKNLGINSEIVITQVARLDPWKDFDTLIKAVHNLKLKGYDFKLILVGDGVLKKKIEKLLADKKLESNVLLVGETKNVHSYIRISDICVLSTKGEGFSNAILEYMSYSKAVVSSDVGGNTELIGKNKRGRLFKMGSSSELTSILEELILNKSLRDKIGIESNIFIRKKCNIDKYISSYEKLFKFYIP